MMMMQMEVVRHSTQLAKNTVLDGYKSSHLSAAGAPPQPQVLYLLTQ